MLKARDKNYDRRKTPCPKYSQPPLQRRFNEPSADKSRNLKPDVSKFLGRTPTSAEIATSILRAVKQGIMDRIKRTEAAPLYVCGFKASHKFGRTLLAAAYKI